MSTFKRPPIKNRFADVPAPKEYVDTENIVKMFSMLGQGNFGAFRDFLLEVKIDINVSFEGMTAITEIIKTNKASEDKKLELLEYLGRRLHVNTSDEKGLTPLHYAVKGGYEKLVKHLLKHGANVSTTADNGLTPLHYATLITLKDCPKENMPQELIEKDKNVKTKTSDITQKLMNIFDERGTDISINDTDISGVYDYLQYDVSGVKLLYNNLIEEMVNDQNITEKLKDLFSKGNKSNKEIVDTFSKNLLSEIKTKLKFPDKFMEHDELTKTDTFEERTELYNTMIQELIKSLYNILSNKVDNEDFAVSLMETEEFYKKTQNEFELQVDKLIKNFGIKNIKSKDIIRQSLANEQRMKTEYIPEMYGEVGDNNYRAMLNTVDDFIEVVDEIPALENNFDISINTLNIDGQTPDPSDLSLNILTYNDEYDELEKDSDISSQEFLDYFDIDISYGTLYEYNQILAPYSTNVHHDVLNKIFNYNGDIMNVNKRNVDNAKYNIIIINSLINHYNKVDMNLIVKNLGKSRLHMLFIAGLGIHPSYDISLNNVIAGKFTIVDEQTGLNEKVLTTSDFKNVDILKNLYIALRYPNKQTSEIVNYVTTHFGNNMLIKTILIKILLRNGITDLQTMIEGQNPYNSFMITLERGAFSNYLSAYPYKDVRDNYNRDNFAQSMLTRLIRQDGYNGDVRTIDEYMQILKNSDPMIQFINNIGYYNKTLDDNSGVANLTNYNDMDKSFTQDYNAIKDEKVIRDILSTFYAFCITLFKRYLFDNIHYGPRSTNRGDTSNKKIFDLIITLLLKYNFAQSNNMVHNFAIKENIEEYIKAYDLLFYTPGVPGGAGASTNIWHAIPHEKPVELPLLPAPYPLPAVHNDATDINNAIIENFGAFNYIELVTKHIENHVATPGGGWINAPGNGWFLGAPGVAPGAVAPLAIVANASKQQNMNILFNTIIDSAIEYVYKTFSLYDKNTIISTLKTNIVNVDYSSKYENIMNYAKYPDKMSNIPTYHDGNGYAVNPALGAPGHAQGAGGIYVLPAPPAPPPGQDIIKAMTQKVNSYNNEIKEYNKNVRKFNNDYQVGNYVSNVYDALRQQMKSELEIKIRDVIDIKSTDGINIVNANKHMRVFDGTDMLDNAGNNNGSADISNYYVSLFYIKKINNYAYTYNTNHQVKIPPLSSMSTVNLTDNTNQWNKILSVDPNIGPNDQLYNGLIAMLLTLKNQMHYMYLQSASDSNVTKFKNYYNMYHHLSLLTELHVQIFKKKELQYLNLIDKHIPIIINQYNTVKSLLDTISANYGLMNNMVFAIKQQTLTTISNVLTHYNDQYTLMDLSANQYNRAIDSIKDVTDKLIFADKVNEILPRDDLTLKIIYDGTQHHDGDVPIESREYFKGLNDYMAKGSNDVSGISDVINGIGNDMVKFHKDISDNYPEFLEDFNKEMINALNSNVKHIHMNHYIAGAEGDISYNPFPVDLESYDNKTTDMININDMNIIGSAIYKKSDDYKLLQKVIDRFDEIKLSDDYKHEILDDHMRKIYNRFVTIYMNNYIHNVVVENIKKSIDNTHNIKPNINTIVLEPEDYNVEINSIKSKLRDYINGKTASYNDHDNVKLIEDEDYDIYAVENDHIESNGSKSYIFYSYDYYNKHDELKCIELNTEIITELIKNGSNIHATDMNGKSVIDYMIEARMYYLLKNNAVKTMCKKPQNIVLMSNYEKKHNTLFYKHIEPNSPLCSLALNHQTDFINKLKLLDAVKQNIPINLRYIFMVFTILQNIHWYRIMNGNNYGKNEYTGYVEYTGDNLLESYYDWKQLFEKDIKVDKTSKEEKKRIKRRKERTENNRLRLSDEQKDRMNENNTDTEEVKKQDIMDIAMGLAPVIYTRKGDISGNKVIDYFNYYAKQYNNVPTNYTHMWKSIIDSIMEKPYIIHSRITREYNDLLSDLESKNSSTGILADNTVTYNTEKIKLLTEGCVKLNTIIKPIEQDIDNRIIPNIYELNQLFKFHIQVYVHILSTFLGSHIYMSMKRIVELAGSKSGTDPSMNEVLLPLKQYVLSTDVSEGNLSYDFLRAHLNFQMYEDEYVEPKKTADLFTSLTSKLDALDKYALSNNKIINKIDAGLGPYYLALYQETINALMNYSDGYMRFTKNQILGIKFLSELN